MESFEFDAFGIVGAPYPARPEPETVTFDVILDVRRVDGPKRGKLVEKLMGHFGNDLVGIKLPPGEPWVLTFKTEVPEEPWHPVFEGAVVIKDLRSPELVQAMVEKTAESFRFKWPQAAAEES